AYGRVGPRLHRLLEEHARRRGFGEAGDDAVAILGLHRAAGLDDELLVAGIDGDEIDGVAEPILELQRRAGAAGVHRPIEDALALERGRRQAEALDGVADGLRVAVAGDMA